jgi:serine/threonine protein kinase
MDSLTVDDFIIGEKIGKGRFGHVFTVTLPRAKKAAISTSTSSSSSSVPEQQGDSIYAMKVLFKQELVQNGILDQLLKEVEIQNKLRHKYILRLKFCLQDSKRVYLFTDVAPFGSVYAFQRRIGKFPADIAGKYLRQLLNALTYLHANSVIHRDIKPENLLIGESGNLLLADFGWCTPIDDLEGRMTVCGTPDYLPPEMVQHKRYSSVVDSWTVGVLCYEFLTGHPPFGGMTQQEKYDNAVAGKYTCPPYIPEGAKSFLSVSLRVDPEKRYTAGELFLHPWIQEQDENGRSIVDYERSLASGSVGKQTGEAVEQLDDQAFVTAAVSRPNIPKGSRCNTFRDISVIPKYAAL